jgi:MerR family transcriptional regulator, heat shock protein HspR
MSDRSAGQDEQRLDAAAAATHVPPSRVRYFVRVGLIRPSRVEGSVPFFGEAEMAQLRRIRRLRDDLGLNMAGIEVALRLRDEIEALRRELGKGGAEGGRVLITRSRRAGGPGSRRTRTSPASDRDEGGSNGRL